MTGGALAGVAAAGGSGSSAAAAAAAAGAGAGGSGGGRQPEGLPQSPTAKTSAPQTAVGENGTAAAAVEAQPATPQASGAAGQQEKDGTLSNGEEAQLSADFDRSIKC